MIKKFIILIILIVFCLNAFFISTSYADPNDEILTPEDVEDILNEGEVSGSSDADRNTEGGIIPIANETDRSINPGSEQGGFIAATLGALVQAIAEAFSFIMDSTIEQDLNNLAEVEKNLENNESFFTVQKLVLGKYELFDINVFELEAEQEYQSKISETIKKSVATWFYTLRNIAIILNLIVLIYVAIRMVMSSATGDGRHIRMFNGWVIGFGLLFIIHFIPLLMMAGAELIVQLLAQIVPKDVTSFEVEVASRLFYSNVQGWDYFLASVLFFMLTFFQLRFFIIYFKRLIVSAFLIVISPLVVITFAVDRAAARKPAHFMSWMEEMITNVFIQPTHALLMIILLYTAGEIAKLYPVIAILLLLGIIAAEKILRKLFNLNGMSVKHIGEVLKIGGKEGK